MKQIRKGVFETNSSSSHSISLEYSNRRFSRVNKLTSNTFYSYMPVGKPITSKRVWKTKYVSEYEKLCVLCDLMFQQFLEYRESTYYAYDYKECVKIAQSKNTDLETISGIYYMNLFKNTNYYKLLYSVLKKHNVEFKFTKEFYGNAIKREHVEIKYFEDVVSIDYIHAFLGNAFDTMEETIEKIIFNASYILKYEVIDM